MPDQEIYEGKSAPKEFAAQRLWPHKWAGLCCGIRTADSMVAVVPLVVGRLVGFLKPPATIGAPKAII